VTPKILFGLIMTEKAVKNSSKTRNIENEKPAKQI